MLFRSNAALCREGKYKYAVSFLNKYGYLLTSDLNKATKWGNLRNLIFTNIYYWRTGLGWQHENFEEYKKRHG